MIAWLDLLWLFFLLAFATWVLVVAAVPAIIMLAVRTSLAPSVRARRGLLIAGLPWIAPLIVIASVCVLAASKQLGWIADHCIYHGPGHPHLCFEHLPAIGLSSLHAFGASLAVACLLLVLVRFIRRERQMTSRVNALRVLARGRRRLRILDDHQPFAFAAGFGDAFVLLSRGLLQQLSPRQRRIVLAHEVAHLRHRDLPLTLLFEILLLLHIPSTARELRSLWRQALEERADDRVATHYGVVDVAGTLIKVLRVSRSAPVLAFAVAGADPLKRVKRLLCSDDELPGRRWRFELVYLTLLLAAAAAVLVAHHPLETLLGVITGA